MDMLPPFDPWNFYSFAMDAVSTQAGDKDGIAARRTSRLASLLASAAGDSPYYRRHLKGCSPGISLDDMPVVRKADLMAHFDDWVTDTSVHLDDLRAFVRDPSKLAQPFLGRYVVWESSGSSGEPGVFIQDALAMAVYDALEVTRGAMRRSSSGLMATWAASSHIVFLGATSGHFASVVSVERLRRINPWLARVLRSVSFLQPIDRIRAELHALNPMVIATYPSMALMLAEDRHAGRLAIKPRELWTGGESLSAATRCFLTDIFECPVIDSYGASEFLAMATECVCGALHLNSDWVILEPVDEHDRPVPPDTFGSTTLLTNLANRSQPLIRYDLGDRVALRSGCCACGLSLPVIEVQGRSDDTLRLAGVEAPSVCLTPLALSTLLEGEAGLFDFQLVQRGPSDLLLRTSLPEIRATEPLRRATRLLRAYLKKLGVKNARIHSASDQTLGVGRTGKVQRVVCECPSKG